MSSLSPTRPNVLLLYTDQQRWDALGAAGNPHIKTPNLDALAAEGALCEQAYANCPLCMPSRQSMLSGLYPSTVGTLCNGYEMPPETTCIHNVLAPYGYHTANLGKLHFVNHSNRDHRSPHPDYGFDEALISDEPGCYEDPYLQWVREQDPAAVEKCMCSTPPKWVMEPVKLEERNTTDPYVFRGPEHLTHSAFVADQTIHTIRRCAGRQQPFFAIAGFFAPHCPLNPPQRFVDMYDPASLPLPKMTDAERAASKLSDDDWRKVKQYYYALVTHVDDQIGRILRELDGLGLREDTLVVFVSDHGEHLGDHGRIQKGPPCQDSSARVPLLLRYPRKIPAGTRVTSLVELVDVAPTLIDFAGVQTPPQMQGRSLRPVLEGRASEHRDSAYVEYRMDGVQHWREVVTDRYKYGFEATGNREFFIDREADPDDLVSTHDDPAHAAAISELRAILLARVLDAYQPPRPRVAAY